MSEFLYFHQTFTDCVSDKCTHFDDMSICQIYLQVVEGSLYITACLKRYNFIKVKQIVFQEV